MKNVQSAGAIGVIMGLFIDENGQEVLSPVHDRQIGASLGTLKAIPQRICVAGGLQKTEAIRAALKGGFVTHLVTDETTAESLARKANTL